MVKKVKYVTIEFSYLLYSPNCIGQDIKANFILTFSLRNLINQILLIQTFLKMRQTSFHNTGFNLVSIFLYNVYLFHVRVYLSLKSHYDSIYSCYITPTFNCKVYLYK